MTDKPELKTDYKRRLNEILEKSVNTPNAKEVRVLNNVCRPKE